MVEPEIAFADLNDDADLAESFLKSILTAVLNERGDDLAFFAPPAPGTFGNEGLNALRGPGLEYWSLVLMKDVPLRGGSRPVRAQVAVEFHGAIVFAGKHGLVVGKLSGQHPRDQHAFTYREKEVAFILREVHCRVFIRFRHHVLASPKPGAAAEGAETATNDGVGIEPVLLAATIPARPGQVVLEGGTGAGAAMLCLAARVPGLRGVGLERQPPLAALAAANNRDSANPVKARTTPGLRRRRGPHPERLSADHHRRRRPRRARASSARGCGY